MTGNCILLAVNLVLAAGGALYRRGHPLDPVAAEKLREKHQAERAYSGAPGQMTARVAVPVGVLLAVLYIFGSGAASGRTETPDPVHFAQILQEKGYETADVSLTYGRIDRNKLTQAIAGAKGGSRWNAIATPTIKRWTWCITRYPMRQPRTWSPGRGKVTRLPSQAAARCSP